MLVCGCPAKDSSQTGNSSGSGTGSTGTAAGLQDQVIAMVFSSTEGDDWARGLLATVGDELGFDPWSTPAASGHIDLFGPYVVTQDERKLTIYICFSGLANILGMAGQQAVAVEVLDWLEGIKPSVIWIDGDQAQLQVGQKVIEEHPVLFTGIVLDCGLYYDLGERYTGLYKRHSMSAVFGEVWKLDPDAGQFALVTDDSHTSAVRVKRFVDIQSLLPEGYSFHVPKTVHNWDELADVLDGLEESIDAVIVTGMGLEGSSDKLTAEPCPAEVLSGVGIPVVTLGPTRMDGSGVTSVSIDAAVHARMGLLQAMDIADGTDPRDFVPITPEEMALFRSETGTAVNSSPEQ